MALSSACSPNSSRSSGMSSFFATAPMACSRRWTLCPTACFQLEPGLTWRHIIHGDELAAATNLMSSSNSICRLRFTVHGRDRFLHRAHGALPFVMWHLIWRTSARDTCTRRFGGIYFLTFCRRHATQAVIFLLISGGLPSPKDSLSAATPGRHGALLSMTAHSQPANT